MSVPDPPGGDCHRHAARAAVEAIIGVRTRLYNQPMAAKPLPNDDRYLAVLRAMSPEQRVRKAAELSELTKGARNGRVSGRGSRISARPRHAAGSPI